MEYKWISFIGLLFDIIGTGFLSYGLIITKKDAVDLSVSRVCGSTQEENLELPQTKDRLKQSNNAIIGLIFLVIGFLLQATVVLVTK